MRLPHLLLVLPCALAAGVPAPPDTTVVDEAAEALLGETLAGLHAEVLAGDLRPAPRPLEDPWVARTEHYQVSACSDPRFASWAANELELQLSAMQKWLGTDRAPAAPFRVVIFPTLEAYNTLGEEYDARSSITGGFFANEAKDGFVATYESDNYNLMREHLTYGAFLQYADFLSPRRNVPAALEQALASYFAARASLDLASFHFDRFVAVRDRAPGTPRWTPVPQLLLLGTDGFAGAEGGARRDQLVQLVSFLTYYYGPTRGGEDGAPGLFQDYVRKAFTGQDVSEHPLLGEVLETSKLRELDGLLRAFRGWSPY